MRVGILRPENYAKETIKKFEEHGISVIYAPFIRIVEKDVKNVRDAEYTIITSRTSAEIALRKGLIRGEVISIGKKTSEFLMKFGVNSYFPSKYDSKTLYKEYKDLFLNKRVNILRSDKGDPILLKLSKICDLKEYKLYEVRPYHGDKQREMIREVSSLNLDALIFSSRMIVNSFFDLAKDMDVLNKVVRALKSMKIIAIGPPTRLELRKYGIDAEIPNEYNFNGILKLLIKNC